MKSEIKIREFKKTDKFFVLNLLELNTPKYFSPEEEKDLIYYLDEEIEQYYVVEYKNKIIGCGGINCSKDFKIGKISWDIFHPSYQNKGIGRLLLNFRIEKLKSLKKVQTISVRTSQLVYKFYEKCGFEIIGIKKDYWAKGLDLYDMEFRK